MTPPFQTLAWSPSSFPVTFLSSPAPPHPSGSCVPASCPPSGSLHTHPSVALCRQVRPPLLLGSRVIPLPACWTPPPGDLLRHGRTNLDPSRLRISQVLPRVPPYAPHQTGSSPAFSPPSTQPQTTMPEPHLAHSSQHPKCLSNPSPRFPVTSSYYPVSGLGTQAGTSPKPGNLPASRQIP